MGTHKQKTHSFPEAFYSLSVLIHEANLGVSSIAPKWRAQKWYKNNLRMQDRVIKYRGFWHLKLWQKKHTT